MRGTTYEEIRAERVEASRIEGDRYRTLSDDQDREINSNWWIIERPEIEKAVRQASAKTQARFGEFFELDDLESDAWVAAARIADRAAECLTGDSGHNMGTFQHELEMDLLDLYRPIYGRHGRTVPGFESEDDERDSTRLFDQVGTLRGGSSIELVEDEAAVL